MSEKTLQPHEQRVVEEKEQLGERLGKLREFLDKGQPKFIDDKKLEIVRTSISSNESILRNLIDAN